MAVIESIIGERAPSWGGRLRRAPIARLPAPSAFTLIELLVVIGIIGVLAGLLLPALSRARERGRMAGCLSHLKQMSVAMMLYAQDNETYPPGRQAGVTQWDLCLGTLAGGKENPLTPEARSALFMCPSATKPNNGTRLNYSANPNVFKEILPTAGPAKPESIGRPVDVIVVADSIQYAVDGSSHAILWGVVGSSGTPIYWNNGNPANAGSAVPVGMDRDQVFATADPVGSNLRYRHGSSSAQAMFADGHVETVHKGKLQDRNLYTNY